MLTLLLAFVALKRFVLFLSLFLQRRNNLQTLKSTAWRNIIQQIIACLLSSCSSSSFVLVFLSPPPPLQDSLDPRPFLCHLMACLLLHPDSCATVQRGMTFLLQLTTTEGPFLQERFSLSLVVKMLLTVCVQTGVQYTVYKPTKSSSSSSKTNGDCHRRLHSYSFSLTLLICY